MDDPNLERVRQFARTVRGDLAKSPMPGRGQAAQAGAARAGMLAGMGQPAPMGAMDQARDLARQRAGRRDKQPRGDRLTTPPLMRTNG